MAEGSKEVKLRIRSCSVAWAGTNKRGDETTIYEIEAERENGDAITDKKLRSFEELPVGDDLLDLLVKPFQSERHGLSYTLSRRQKVSKTAELQAKVKELADRLERVEAWVRQQAGAQPAVAQAAAPAAAQPDARQQDLDARFGADAPF